MAGKIENVDVKSFGSSKSIDLLIDALSAPITSEFAVFKGKINNTYSGDDSFGVSVFAKNGKEYRKSVSANTPFEFNTLPEGIYSIVVFSEHSLQVFSSVEMSIEKETDFSKLVKEDKILVDFFATWCGPCRMLAPVLEKAESNIKVVKVDTDKFDDLAREYGVMSIPTLVLLEKGKEVKRNIGFIDKNNLETFLK